MMIKLWIKIKRKRKNKPNPKRNKEIKKKINKIRISPARNKNRKNSPKLRKKERNLGHFRIALTIVSGKRKTDSNKAIKFLLSPVVILTLKEP